MCVCIVTLGGGSHQHDALRRSHRVQAPDQQRAALLRVPAARDEGVHSRVQRSVSTRAFVHLAKTAECQRHKTPRAFILKCRIVSEKERLLSLRLFGIPLNFYSLRCADTPLLMMFN